MMLSIEDLEGSKDKTITYRVEEEIDGINAKGPIKADLTFKSLGDFVEVQGKIKGTVLLECDLCLKEYEYNFDFEINELYAKQALIESSEESGQEFEIKEGQFVIDLNGANEIDIYDLLYQSVILNLPNKKVCGINCKGKDKFSQEEEISDPRMDIFKRIKIEI